MKTTDFITENQFIGDDAHAMHQDHEVQMARSDCYSSAKYAIELHKLLKNVSEMTGLDGWVSEKLTLANDYLRTVHEYLTHEMVHPEEVMPEMFTAESAEIQFAELLGETTSKQVDMKGKKCTTCKKGTYEETSQHDDMDGVLHCTKCQKEVKRHRAADSKKKNVSEGIMDVVKQTFNDCVAGYPQGTSEGQFLQGWARAIRAETGRDIPAEKLAKLYQDYTQRSPEIMQSHGTMDESGPGDANRLEHRGEEYNVYFNQRKGMYTARGTGQMKGQIQFEWFHTLADAIDHAEMEIGGYDEHDGVAEGSLGSSPDRLDARTGINISHKTPRSGQTNLGNVPGGNQPGSSRDTTAYMNVQRAERSAKLKSAIKGQLGKHHKPNLPEQDVAEGMLTHRDFEKPDDVDVMKMAKMAAKGLLTYAAKTKMNPANLLKKDYYALAAMLEKTNPQLYAAIDAQLSDNDYNWLYFKAAALAANAAAKHGVAEAKEKTPGVALSKAYKKDFDGKKPGQDRPETALTGAYSKTGKPGGALKKTGVSETTSAGMATAPGVGKGPATGTLFGGSYAPKTPFTGKKKSKTSVIKR